MSISPLHNKDVETFANRTSVMMWSADSTGAREWFNRTWLEFRGRSLAEECGFGWTQGVHPDDLAPMMEILRGALLRRGPYEAEYRLRHREGDWRWVLTRGNPYDADGQFAGHIGSCADITHHRSNEEKLGDALVEREALLREIHHRVKNNLQTMMALMRFMRRSASQEGREVLDVLNLRLATMALVQKYLHAADTITEVSAAGMLSAILPELIDMGVGMALNLDRSSGDLVLPGQASAYLGLSVSEAIILFAQHGCQSCHIAFESEGGVPSIVLQAQGCELDGAHAQLGQKLVRQYARGAGAMVAVGQAEEGPSIRLNFIGR